MRGCYSWHTLKCPNHQGTCIIRVSVLIYEKIYELFVRTNKIVRSTLVSVELGSIVPLIVQFQSKINTTTHKIKMIRMEI